MTTQRCRQTATDVRKPSKREIQMARQKSRERFVKARRAENVFVRQLRSVADQVGAIVRAFAPKGVVDDVTTLRTSLEQYAATIRPWARAVVARMQAEVGRRDEKAWLEAGREIGRELRREIQHAPTGQLLKQRMAEQVELITSLPKKAAERVHDLTIHALSSSERAESIQEKIFATGKVTKSRAELIARTEVSRTASELTAARAKFINSPGYIWRTSMDSDVRPLHKELEGKVFAWDDPPVTGDKGERSLPGGIYRCRCWPEPIIPDQL